MRDEQRRMIDEAMAELRAEHAPRLRAAAASLLERARAGVDRDAIRRDAHKLRGSCGSFGLDELGVAAGMLEDAIERGEPIEGALDALQRVLA